MMAPRSFLYSNRQQPLHKSSPSASASYSSSSSFSSPSSTTSTSPASTSPPAAAAAIHLRNPSPSVLDRRKDAQNVTISVTAVPDPTPTLSRQPSARAMARRKDAPLQHQQHFHIFGKGDAVVMAVSESTTSATPSKSPATVTARPLTPTGPVQIPIKPKRDGAHQHPHHGQRKPSRPTDVHSPESVPSAMRALLAVTEIPRPRPRGARHKAQPAEKTLTLEDIIERQQVSEKELSLTLSKSPMDLLLSPPEELDEDDMSVSDSGLGSFLSTRTVSVESMPSLGHSFSTDTLSSSDSPLASSPRRARLRRPRRSLEPVASPPGQIHDHPLSAPKMDVEDLDFRVFRESEIQCEQEPDPRSELSFSDYAFPLRPLKSAFKSNLTASLRALRHAARSFSAMNFPSIPPDDFLTRSILTIDPKVPYTDERRPPVLEEEPSAELRRYLNPTTNARIETHPAAVAPTRAFTASIQLQTYKVQRSRSVPASPHRNPAHAVAPAPPTQIGQESPASYTPPAQTPGQTAFSYPPGAMRQREMRENSDFIRIAVMEMAMRKRGKLDDQRPGRARWALPPRKASNHAYVVGSDGVPARWVPVTN